MIVWLAAKTIHNTDCSWIIKWELMNSLKSLFIYSLNIYLFWWKCFFYCITNILSLIMFTSKVFSFYFRSVAELCTMAYPGSRGLFSKYLISNKPCLRFDKAPESYFFLSAFRASLTRLRRERSVSIRKKHPLEPRVTMAPSLCRILFFIHSIQSITINFL